MSKVRVENDAVTLGGAVGAKEYEATDADLSDLFWKLTPPPEGPPSREDWLIAQMERRFGGRAVRVKPREEEIVEPEVYEPPKLEEPEWERLGFRGQVAKLLWARGLKRKAIRFLNCNRCGRPGVCSRYPDEHKYFIPHGCEVVFCKECADVTRRECLLDYWHVVCNVVADFGGEREGHETLCSVLFDPEVEPKERRDAESELLQLWARVGQHIKESGHILARVTFTLKSDGGEITPDRVKKFNACVREVMTLVGKEVGKFGMLFVDEVGYEMRGHLPDEQRITHGLNLHCHGLYFGPYLDWGKTRDLWMEITEKAFGEPSRGFYITAVRWFAQNPARAIRWALNHMFKYVSKPPAVTPERLALLIAAFHGTRRVHALGLFYGKKPEREKKDCLCPKCKALGIISTVSFEGRLLPNGGCIPRIVPIEELVAQGYVPLREAGRDAVLSMGEARAP